MPFAPPARPPPALSYITAEHIMNFCERMGMSVDIAEVQEAIAGADEDHDGRVNFDEFVRVMTPAVHQTGGQTYVPTGGRVRRTSFP